MKMTDGEVTILPDGSAFTTVSFPLPKDHWIYAEPESGYEEPPMVMKMGTDNPERKEWTEKLRTAGRYAVRAATMNGKEMDFDPDALVQNLVIAVLGYYTPDGNTHA